MKVNKKNVDQVQNDLQTKTWDMVKSVASNEKSNNGRMLYIAQNTFKMFENNQFQAQKESSASYCDHIVVDNRYGIEVYFGPHSGQLRNEMLNLVNEVDFQLFWANSRIDDQILANALKSAESSVLSIGVLNGSDEQGGQQAL